MIPVTSFAGETVAVFGLGTSGIASARALAAGGARVIAWDDAEKSAAAATDAGVPVVDLREVDWSRVAALVLAPGVPLTHPEPHWTVRYAAAAGVEVIGDIELFCRERRRHAPEAPFVAVTGTNGKSTTTALIAHLLRSVGRDVQLGGNIGTAILSLEPPRPGRYHVVECSSFQIDLAPSLDPSVGLLLNLAEDHLDRHGTFELYEAIKRRLVEHAALAVVGVDDERCAAIADHLAQAGRPTLRVASRNPLAHGIYAEGESIFEATNGASVRVADLRGVGSLRGQHNAQNAVAAIAAVHALGLDYDEIAIPLKTFPGLPHRMEEVGRLGSVLFINDSKATNADAAARALASFERIYWIAGGRAKSGGIVSLKRFFPKIVQAYLIGEAAEEFAATLDGEVPYRISETLAAATIAAAGDAAISPSGQGVVLLSPACASYDQFKNFEQRGDGFRALVQALNGVRTSGVAA